MGPRFIVHGKVNFVNSVTPSYMCPLIRNIWLCNVVHDSGVKDGSSKKKYALNEEP